MNSNFKVIGLTRLGIKPESTAPESDVLTTRPSELFLYFIFRVLPEAEAIWGTECQIRPRAGRLVLVILIVVISLLELVRKVSGKKR